MTLPQQNEPTCPARGEEEAMAHALEQENARLRKVLEEIRDDAGRYRHRTEHLHRIELLALEALGEDGCECYATEAANRGPSGHIESRDCPLHRESA